MRFNDNIRDYFDIDKQLYFVFLCLITFLILLSKKILIESETAAFDVLQDRGEFWIFRIVNSLQYLSIPIIYLWKFTVIGFIIWIGSFMFGYKVTYNKCWQIAMIAETIFLIPETMKIVYFFSVATDPNLFDIKAYYPLSLMSLADYSQLDPKWHYPLKALNLFEVIYWGLLVYGVHLAAKKKVERAFLIVLTSYVFLFLLWIWFYVNVYK